MTIGWGEWGVGGEKGGLEAGVSQVVRQQSGLKGTVPILSCTRRLMGLTIWDLGACGGQRNSWGWFLGTELHLEWGLSSGYVGFRHWEILDRRVKSTEQSGHHGRAQVCKQSALPSGSLRPPTLPSPGPL